MDSVNAPVPGPAPPVAWKQIETVMLDMDGTLLDLHFDNLLWTEMIPERYALARKLHRLISSHHFGVPKESQIFWHALKSLEGFDPATTLFIDDTRAVLDSAHHFGIFHLLTVSQPDSQRPPRQNQAYSAFNSFAEIIPPS